MFQFGNILSKKESGAGVAFAKSGIDRSIPLLVD